MSTPTSPVRNPLPHQRRARPLLEATGSRRSYELSTNDGLEAKVVSIKDTASQRVVWSSSRTIEEEEVVETILDSNRHPRWRIHRPIKGWYLLLRSPSLPSQSFISFKPSSSHGPSHLILSFLSILTFPPDVSLLADSPPPPSSTNSPTSPTSKEPARSTFRLFPGVPKHTHRASSSGWSVSSLTGIFADRGKTFSCVWEEEGESEVMRYEDSPSMISMKTRGTLFLNEQLVDIIGMEPSFWVAVAVAYLEFLEDQEAYQASRDG